MLFFKLMKYTHIRTYIRIYVHREHKHAITSVSMLEKSPGYCMYESVLVFIFNFMRFIRSNSMQETTIGQQRQQ